MFRLHRDANTYFVVGIVALALTAFLAHKYAESIGFPDRLPGLVQAEE